MTKIAGFGSISQRHGSADLDPDPRQNVMDPEHCLQEESGRHFLYQKDAMVTDPQTRTFFSIN
jgi:hypothetical protein